MTERPTLGFSSVERHSYRTTALDRMRRLGFVLVALVLVGVVFFYLTRAVQSSTAHATSGDSALHYEP